MNIKKLNEEIESCLNEISDKLKGQALGKRIAKAREAIGALKDNLKRNYNINEDQYESPDEEEFYTVTFTDGTTDNGFSYADGELFYNNEFIADIIDANLYPEIPHKIVTYCEIELGKGVESIMDGAGQIWESMNEISEAGKDYEHARELGYSDAQDFNVGDQVKLIWSGRNGIITKQIGVDVYEIEFPETPGLMARTDRYYANDLELVKSKIIDNKEVDINESQKVLVSTDYGVSATLLMNEPNEEYKFVIVDQDGDGISWSDSEEEVINQYIEYMIKHEPETDAISDIMTKEDSVKDNRIKQAFTNYLDSLDK